eukprot:7406424-Heterocapsa_arctica.AAC.1
MSDVEDTPGDAATSGVPRHLQHSRTIAGPYHADPQPVPYALGRLLANVVRIMRPEPIIGYKDN